MLKTVQAMVLATVSLYCQSCFDSAAFIIIFSTGTIGRLVEDSAKNELKTFQGQLDHQNAGLRNKST